MNRDEVIELAGKAGFIVDELSRKHQPNCIFHTWHMVDEGLTRFAALVSAAEREECAQIVDHILKEGGGTYGDAIRARSKE